MFATYLINKGLVSRIPGKPKNQKEKDSPNKKQATQQTDIHRRRDMNGSQIHERMLSFISYQEHENENYKRNSFTPMENAKF